MSTMIPPKPANTIRVTINLDYAEERLDAVLLKALKEQTENDKLKSISRTMLKALFKDGKISIKGQNAKPSSALAKGVTYVDIAI